MPVRMIPNANRLSISANGRNYTGKAGVVYPNIPEGDAGILGANGWTLMHDGDTGFAEMNSEMAYGIPISPSENVYGWRDITSDISVKGAGANNPAWAQYGTTSIYGYQFENGKTEEAWINFHIPHDYVPGSDIFIHAHWSQTTADAGKTVEWSFDALYAKGFVQQAFPSSVATVSAPQACSSTVRQHMIAEVQLSTAGTIGGNAIEVDGIILARVYRVPGSGSDNATVAPFLHFCDIHYQSSNMATKNKAPNFYL